MTSSIDKRVRIATFDWLTEQTNLLGDVLPRNLLAKGFEFDGQRVPILGPQGIFKPRLMDFPLSLTTVPSGPYEDSFGEDGMLRYRYRGTDPMHHENRGVRETMQRRLPLVYFHRLIPGKYLAAWPVYIVGDDPSNLVFTVAVDDAIHAGLLSEESTVNEDDGARRRYITTVVRRRLHQSLFRERVLAAYRGECAFCHFRHEELLDAAHIAGDSTPDGEPRVSNGLALCRLHHAAFDRHFIGLRPDYTLAVRPDLLAEVDGPTLEHGIQALEGSRIAIPRSVTQRPNVQLVEARFSEFLARAS